jgi:hypothetical protein
VCTSTNVSSHCRPFPPATTLSQSKKALYIYFHDLTATARFPAATVTLETLDLLLPILDSKAVREFDEVPLEGQTFTVEQDEEHRRHDPTQ